MIRIVTDSSCDLPDEVIGLPAGFLMAGAPGVVGSLWPVNDISTAPLMERFYYFYCPKGRPPAVKDHFFLPSVPTA